MMNKARPMITLQFKDEGHQELFLEGLKMDISQEAVQDVTIGTLHPDLLEWLEHHQQQEWECLLEEDLTEKEDYDQRPFHNQVAALWGEKPTTFKEYRKEVDWTKE